MVNHNFNPKFLVAFVMCTQNYKILHEASECEISLHFSPRCPNKCLN